LKEKYWIRAKNYLTELSLVRKAQLLGMNNITVKSFKLLKLTPIKLLVLVIAILLCYSHTLDVPFYYDDNGSLRNNPAILGIDLAKLWAAYSARIVGYITFAFNHSIHGNSVSGYHVFNIFIHFLASLAVFILATLFLKTPALKDPHQTVKSWLPILTALLFALHPLQIQAVTYIVQRLASLAAMFYLASLCAYLAGRLTQKKALSVFFFLFCFQLFILGFSTKQNAITLPLAIFIIEICFFRHEKRFYLVIGSFLLFSFFIAVLAAPFLLDQPFFSFVDNRTRETQLFSRSQYFLVQLHVLWEYIFKYLLPLNLTLNYENPIPASFLQPATLLFGFMHLSALAFAFYMIRKAPLIAFGILFYYCAHLVESSVIPIRDFGFDHRTYLPNFGLFLATATGLLELSRNYPSKIILALTGCYLMTLGLLTWQRNELWRSPIEFFQHEARINQDFRSFCLLGQAYYENQDKESAAATYRQGWPSRQNLINRGNNTFSSCASNFAATLQETMQLEEARALINELPNNDFPLSERTKNLVTLGNIEALSGNFREAENYFGQARQLNPFNTDAISNLGKLKLLTEDIDAAYELFSLLNNMDPSNQDSIIALDYIEQLRNE
jgi:tetratricopeptide (TPR) repeat protein